MTAKSAEENKIKTKNSHKRYKFKTGFKKTCNVKSKSADYGFNFKIRFYFWCENTLKYTFVIYTLSLTNVY